MIRYRSSGCSFGTRILRVRGSVFPASFVVALPCALITAAMTEGMKRGLLKDLEGSVLSDNAAWAGFNFLVGFLIVFRTSQSYNRFWDGCHATHLMKAEWFAACSSLIAFSSHSQVDSEKINRFQNMLVRLFSMLHASAFAEIEEHCNKEVNDYKHVHHEMWSIDRQAFQFELLDVEGIDDETLQSLREAFSKVELLFQWIQQLIVQNLGNGVLCVPPPILSRAFQELADGMIAYHSAMKISSIPFPFPYAQTCDFLLVLQWLLTPFVISQWVSQPAWALVFSFTQVFILWALNFIAIQLENPFGMDANDIDAQEMQQDMNDQLLLLMSPTTQRVPQLSQQMQDLSAGDMHELGTRPSSNFRHDSFSDAWLRISTSEKNRTLNRTSIKASRREAMGNVRRKSAVLSGVGSVNRSDICVDVEDCGSRSEAGSSFIASEGLGSPQLSPKAADVKDEDAQDSLDCLPSSQSVSLLRVEGKNELYLSPAERLGDNEFEVSSCRESGYGELSCKQDASFEAVQAPERLLAHEGPQRWYRKNFGEAHQVVSLTPREPMSPRTADGVEHSSSSPPPNPDQDAKEAVISNSPLCTPRSPSRSLHGAEDFDVLSRV